MSWFKRLARALCRPRKVTTILVPVGPGDMYKRVPV